RAVINRDIIDLSMMISRFGPIPEAAWSKAKDAYGETVVKAYDEAVQAIRDPRWLKNCMTGMGMDLDLMHEILAPHGGPCPRPSASTLPPGRSDRPPPRCNCAKPAAAARWPRCASGSDRASPSRWSASDPGGGASLR